MLPFPSKTMSLQVAVPSMSPYLPPSWIPDFLQKQSRSGSAGHSSVHARRSASAETQRIPKPKQEGAESFLSPSARKIPKSREFWDAEHREEYASISIHYVGGSNNQAPVIQPQIVAL